MPGVDLVGVEILKNHLATTGGPGGRPSPPGLGFPSLTLRVDKIDMNCSKYNPLSTVKVLSTRTSNMDTILKKPKIDLIRPKRKKTWKSSEWRHIHRFGCPKNPLLKNIKFWFLGRMREILAVHR